MDEIYDDPTIGDPTAHSTGYNLLAMQYAAMEESDGGQGNGSFGPGAAPQPSPSSGGNGGQGSGTWGKGAVAPQKPPAFSYSYQQAPTSGPINNTSDYMKGYIDNMPFGELYKGTRKVLNADNDTNYNSADYKKGDLNAVGTRGAMTGISWESLAAIPAEEIPPLQVALFAASYMGLYGKLKDGIK